MNSYNRLSLLEAIRIGTGCSSLGCLCALTVEQRRDVHEHLVNDIPPNVPTLQDYNEVIHYLLCGHPESTKEEARKRLLEGLL